MFGSMFGSLLLTFSCSSFKSLVNSLEIVFGSCEFLSLYPTTYQHLSPIGISRGFDVYFRSTDGDWKAIGFPIPRLAGSSWPGYNRLGGAGGVFSGWNATGLPMHRSGSSGWTWATMVTIHQCDEDVENGTTLGCSGNVSCHSVSFELGLVNYLQHVSVLLPRTSHTGLVFMNY